MKTIISPLEAGVGKPFVKWAGGKRRLLPEIERALPPAFDKFKTVVEPFVGGGAVFFYLRQKYPHKTFILNDCNQDLMTTYRIVKDCPQRLFRLLFEMQNRYNSLQSLHLQEEYFLSQRELFNSGQTDNIEKAALFIFLNKTGFNGLFRVNSSGKMNVSFGKKRKVVIYDETCIILAGRLLQGVVIKTGDYSHTGEYMGKNSFFFLDPPYRPLTATASFTSYTKFRFDDEEQLNLRKFCDQLHQAGSRWILTNSDGLNAIPQNDLLDRLYQDYHISRITSNHIIKGNNKVTELLITNYEKRQEPVQGRRLWLSKKH